MSVCGLTELILKHVAGDGFHIGNIYLFIEINRITYSVARYTLFYNMVLLRWVKHKPQYGVKYIKQHMCDKNTWMTHPFAAWNGQHEKGHIIPYMYFRNKCPIKLNA